MPGGPTTSFEKGGIHFKIGDQVLVQQAPHEAQPYIAVIQKIGRAAEGNGGHELRISWYYRPEDTARRVSAIVSAQRTAPSVSLACQRAGQRLNRRRLPSRPAAVPRRA